MTRIGFAYNQKPEPTVGLVRRTAESPAPTKSLPVVSDVYAEWDSAETIDAVASALSAYGEVIRLEATQDFPERLRDARPDIVFNIAEGLHGTNREAHVPAICEFFDIPYSGSDPFTLSLCLHKAKTKDFLTRPRHPERGLRADRIRIAARARSCGLHALFAHRPIAERPAVRQAGPGRLVEGNHREEPRPHPRRARSRRRAFSSRRTQQPVLVEDIPPRRRIHLRRARQRRERARAAARRNELRVAARTARCRSTASRRSGSGTRRTIRSTSSSARHGSMTRSPRPIVDVVLRAYRVLGCRDWSRVDVRLDAERRSEHRRSESRSPAFCRIRKTTPVCRKRRARRD